MKCGQAPHCVASRAEEAASALVGTSNWHIIGCKQVLAGYKLTSVGSETTLTGFSVTSRHHKILFLEGQLANPKLVFPDVQSPTEKTRASSNRSLGSNRLFALVTFRRSISPLQNNRSSRTHLNMFSGALSYAFRQPKMSALSHDAPTISPRHLAKRKNKAARETSTTA